MHPYFAGEKGELNGKQLAPGGGAEPLASALFLKSQHCAWWPPSVSERHLKS